MRTSRRIEGASEEQGERLIRILSAATFLIFFQAYMIAPLIPKLADVFHVSAQTIGVAVPAYMIPYGAATLLRHRVGSRRATPDHSRLAGALRGAHNTHRARAVWRGIGLLAAAHRHRREWRCPDRAGADGRLVPLRKARATARLAFWRDGRRDGLRLDVRSSSRTNRRLAKPLRGRWRIGVGLPDSPRAAREVARKRAARGACNDGWRFQGVQQVAGGLARNADLHLCARQRDLPFRGLHVAGVVFCSALSPRRDRHRAGAVGVWRSGIHFRARHWKGCGPLGPALDDSGRTGNCGACGWGAYIPPTDSGCGADGDRSLARV